MGAPGGAGRGHGGAVLRRRHRGRSPLRATGEDLGATTVSAELIEAPDLGRIAPEMQADIIGVPDKGIGPGQIGKLIKAMKARERRQ